MFVIGRGRYARAVYPQASAAVPDDHKVAVTAADAVPNFLQAKLSAGTNIVLTLLNPGGNEQIKIDAAGAALGVPFAAAYYDVAGVPTSVADYLAGKLDAFQRPGVHDFRTGPTSRGATYRLGAWSQDGDPVNVTSEGYVTYGANALGAGPNATDGALGFYEPNGFGAYNVIPGVNGNNTFMLCGFEDGSVNAPFGYQGFQVNSNNNDPYFHVDRTGPNAGFVFIGQSARDNNSSARVQSASIVANAAQYRSSQYGANTGAPGISTIKSRGATIGALVPVSGGDILFRATCVGVAGTNLLPTIPLAAFITIQVPAAFVAAGQGWCPSEFELQLVPMAGPINSRRAVFKVTSEGETQTFAGVRVGGPVVANPPIPPNTPLFNKGALISSGNGDPNLAVTGSIGDLWCRIDGGPGTTLYTKEAGAATNTGWAPIALPSYFNQLAVTTVLPFAPVVLHSLTLTPHANHFFLINYSGSAFNNIVAAGTAQVTFELWIDGVMVTQARESITNNVEYGTVSITYRTAALTAAPHVIEIRASSNDVTGQINVPIPGNSNLMVQEVAA
jgi:hypothetical protein